MKKKRSLLVLASLCLMLNSSAVQADLRDAIIDATVTNFVMDSNYQFTSDAPKIVGNNRTFTIDGQGLYEIDGSSHDGLVVNTVESPSYTGQVLYINNVKNIKNFLSPNDDGAGLYVGAGGGAIVTNSRFFNNRAFKTSGETGGGAVWGNSASQLVFYNVDFDSNSSKNDGGAIVAHNSMMILGTTTFTNNTTQISGGAVALWDNSDLMLFDSTFTGNTSTGTGLGDGNGGAINNGLKSSSNSNALSIRNTEFYSNHANNAGGAISNDTMLNIYGGRFGQSGQGNTANNYGGAIHNRTGYVTVAKDVSNSTIFDSNSSKDGGAIYNNKEMTIFDAQFQNNIASSNGGAIYNTVNSVVNIVAQNNDVAFQNNTASSTSNDIYNLGTVNLFAYGNNKVVFNDKINGSNGTINVNKQTTYKTLDLMNNTVTETLNAGSGSVVFNSDVTDHIINVEAGVLENNANLTVLGGQNNAAINGSGNFTLNKNGATYTNNGSFTQNSLTITKGNFITNLDKLSLSSPVTNDDTLTLNGGTTKQAIAGSGNTIVDGNVSVTKTISGQSNITVNSGAVLNLANENLLNGSTLLTLQNNSSFNMNNGLVSTASIPIIVAAGDSVNMGIDVNVQNQTADSLADGSGIVGNVVISQLNHVGTIPLNGTSIDIANALDITGNQLSLSGEVSHQISQYVTPMKRYSGTFNNGILTYAPLNDEYSGFNPALFNAGIAAQLGGYFAQLNAYDQAFRNMDMYMMMTKTERQAMKLRNKYAASDSSLIYDPTVTQYENKAGWFRPYATFERVNLNYGPTVANNMYGTFFGGDSELKDLGHGWDGMYSVYIGYNGSHQTYDGIGIYQNGGTLGATFMGYKGNLFTGLTANVGGNGVQANTMYGAEDFGMLMAGVASKTGYNFEFKEGKFIIQPSYLMSYSFVNTFNYTNAAGVDIQSDPLHAIQIEPGIKFVLNLKNGWQPYAGVSMVWNIIDKAKFTANDVSLPELSVKPFVKYGLGVRKAWGERFTGFFQAYLTNGGRTGIGLQAGFRWALGKEKDKKADEQKYQNSMNKTPELKKTEISLNGNRIQ